MNDIRVLKVISIIKKYPITLNTPTTNLFTRKHSSRMRTDRAVTRMSSDRVAMRPIVDRMTGAVKTLPSLAVGKYILSSKRSAANKKTEYINLRNK